MNKKLIVNADDFGLHESINDGILWGHNNGIVTSTSIMASGRAFDHGVAKLAAAPNLGIGVHLTVVGAEPLSDPAQIPSLVEAEGAFCPGHPQFVQRYVQGKVRLAEVAREWRIQIQKVQGQGLAITHLDSHQHMHILPGLDMVAATLAKEFNIPAIRIPDEPYAFTGAGNWSMGRYCSRAVLTLLARRARARLRLAGLRTPDRFYGMLNGGDMDKANLLHILAQLQPGITEVMVHPGADDKVLGNCFSWRYHWQDELSALTDREILTEIREWDIQLVSFGVC